MCGEQVCTGPVQSQESRVQTFSIFIFDYIYILWDCKPHYLILLSKTTSKKGLIFALVYEAISELTNDVDEEEEEEDSDNADSADPYMFDSRLST